MSISCLPLYGKFLDERRKEDREGRTDGGRADIQSWTFAYIPLLNKPYENEVTLRGQKVPLKCC